MAFTRLREIDARCWSAATWAVPFVIQVELAAVVVVAWLAGKRFHNGFVQFLIGIAVAVLVAGVIVSLLRRSSSSQAHGIAIGIIGTVATVFVGGLLYGFWLLPW
ncbi:hypothetical protein ABIA30_000530 [Mycobacterium sp. MAA66]|uniref:hypothetical protein n=1 Tax=Mycobacterium sp. MAA66 TaxID=3156297 RepID=UPI003514687D